MPHARIIALFSLMLLFAFPAEVQGEETRARELYDTAVRAAREGDWARSADLFEEAWRLGRDPVLLYNAAFSRAMLGHFGAAIERSQRAEDEGLTGDTRWVNLGRNRAWRSVRRAQIIAETPTRPSATATTSSTEESSAGPAFAWTLTALGVAGIATGLGVDLGLAGEREEFERAQAAGDSDRAQQIAEQTSGRRTTAQVLYVGGAALGIAGVVWLIVRATGKERSDAQLLATPDGVLVRW